MAGCGYGAGGAEPTQGGGPTEQTEPVWGGSARPSRTRHGRAAGGEAGPPAQRAALFILIFTEK